MHSSVYRVFPVRGVLLNLGLVVYKVVCCKNGFSPICSFCNTTDVFSMSEGIDP